MSRPQSLFPSFSLLATLMHCSVSQAISLQCKIWCSSSPAFRCRMEYLHVCLCRNFAFIRAHDYVQPLSTAIRSPPVCQHVCSVVIRWCQLDTSLTTVSKCVFPSSFL
ncbi:hypothetical protein B0H14DRAFT_2696409 [Mycena olivaceomarginata]|nr:hypothetical protein B0H14DRAFT_2696409 [Mycena olivaceomarginata]